jgi:hypothetical protein
MKNKLFITLSFCLKGLMIIVLAIYNSDVFAAKHPGFLTDSTKVLVVGTIHGNHETNSNYSYQDLLNILATYKPDAICVEIRPEDFRKHSYLKEMMMATIFGIDQRIKVYPIDWWGTGDDRSRQSAYIKTPEYKEKEKQEEALVAANKVMQEFDKKYINLKTLWNENKMSYEFFNGEEYNRYIQEMYGISMTVYGDGPMNLSYQTRNGKMLEFIENALKENVGKRIIVLTGAEHKHYFDLALATKVNVRLLDFKDILPLQSVSPDSNIVSFLRDNLAKGYFDDSTPEGIDQLYSGALVPLIHGMGMDNDPNIIPISNLPKAKQLIDKWSSLRPNSSLLQFEIAWVDFLNSDYKKAASCLEKIRDRLDEIPEAQQSFVKPFFYRNLGFCYDMIGSHEKAIKCYNDGEGACKKLGFSESYIKSIFKDYREHPYTGQGKKR